MLRRLLDRLVTRIEAFLGVPAPHMRLMVREAPGALLPTLMLMPFAGYGRQVPLDVLHMVRIGGARAQDCGECLQIAVNLALRDGISPPTVRSAVLSGEGLSETQRTALEFGLTVGGGGDDPAGRKTLREQFGDRGVMELGMAVAGAVVFPVMKRGMGFAIACSAAGVDVHGD